MPLTMAPDINVLLAASRSDHPHHETALHWLSKALAACEQGGSMEVFPMVAAGFLRLATHARVFVNPMPVSKAIVFIDSLLAVPGVEMPELGREWPAFKRLSKDLSLSANDIPDAWIAAAVLTCGSHLVTFDRDFRRLLSRTELTVLGVR
jgi:toxin-antitoxin system PIN domain toxin